ncbi:MAG TPA: hypothetical protein VJ385_10765 [Fibrobacteria bacterium]|nr:hypothetical protein [Fibrobacteria bacterium]
MFPWLPKAVSPGLCLASILCVTALPARAAEPARPRPQAADPFLAAMLGALPLMSGFYLTSTPQKGAVFTLADAMLIGTIVMIRSDENVPPKDASVYFYLLGAVNAADLALSVLQARSDAAARLSVTLNPPDKPGFRLGWRF